MRTQFVSLPLSDPQLINARGESPLKLAQLAAAQSKQRD